MQKRNVRRLWLDPIEGNPPIQSNPAGFLEPNPE